MTRAAVVGSGIVAGVRERDRVRPSDRVEERCELARVRHRDGRDPGRQGVQARVHARADQHPRAGDDRSGVVEVPRRHDLEVRAELGGEGVDRRRVVVAIVRVEHVRQHGDRPGSRKQHPDDRGHRLAVRARVEVGVLLPEQARDVEDDVAMSASRLRRSDGEREVAGHGVDPPTERRRRGGTDRVAREDERRPVQGAAAEHPAGHRPEGADRLRGHDDRATGLGRELVDRRHHGVPMRPVDVREAVARAGVPDQVEPLEPALHAQPPGHALADERPHATPRHLRRTRREVGVLELRVGPHPADEVAAPAGQHPHAEVRGVLIRPQHEYAHFVLQSARRRRRLDPMDRGEESPRGRRVAT